jgi:hypothetical protein
MTMTITSYFCAMLKCRECGAEVQCGNTQEFEEKGTGNVTGYYDPQTGHICGVSEGTGDTFECISCHANKWVEKQHSSNVERLPPQRSGGRQDALVVPDLGQPDGQTKT